MIGGKNKLIAEFDQLLFTQAINDAIFNYKVEIQNFKGGLRVISKEIGISTPTLSRVSNGKMPDVVSLIKILHWLEIPLTCFIKLTTP
jgi:transcriptional regulator with XRE-family HTH domain